MTVHDKLECLSPEGLYTPSLIFVGKARSLAQTGAFERCFTLVGYGLTRKHYTRMERPPETNTLAYYEQF
jgi:hypothetical protein